jgi:hypothetical protein
MKITIIVHGLGQKEKDDKLIEYFNRCLEKHAIVAKKTSTSDFVEESAYENPQLNQAVEKSH